MDDEIKAIVDKAHHDVGSYCITKCKAKCCREGHFILHSEDEMNLMSGDKKKEFLKSKIAIKRDDSQYEFDFFKHSCPHLSEEFKCNIYENSNRFKICSDFPIFLRYRTIFLATFCPAVKDGFFDEYMAKLKELGCKVYLQ